jgi:hypothetical protein
MPLSIRLTKNAHIAYARAEQLQLVVLAPLPHISNDDLREFIAYATNNYHAFGSVRAFFTYSKTARLNPLQRKLLTDTTESLGLELRANAIVTDSLFVRGMLTAMGWMLSKGIKIEGFAPNKVPEALSWLETFCYFPRSEAEQAITQMIAKLSMSSAL